MRSLLAAIALLLLGWPAPAAAQPEPSPAAVQALLADLGVWAQEYNAITAQGAAAMDTVDEYVLILDRFSADEVSGRRTVAAIEAWRRRAQAMLAEARRQAALLREPPSMASLIGAQGEPLDRAIHAGYEGLPTSLDSIGAVLDDLAVLGIGAINDPKGPQEARESALLQSQLQLVRLESDRVAIAVAGLAPDHPTTGLLRATSHYYGALAALARHELAALDGGADPAALAAQLTVMVSGMREELARSEVQAQRMRELWRWRQSGETEQLARMIVQLMDSFPESLRHYRAVADAIERAAGRIRAGDSVSGAWADMEMETLPDMSEIARLDNERARLLAAQPGAL